MRRQRTAGSPRAGLKASLLLSCVLALGTAVSCAKDGTLARLLDFEARSSKGAPSSTVEELKAGIEKYGAEVERLVGAQEKLGTYWKLLAVRYYDKRLFGEAYEAAVEAVSFYPDNAALYGLAATSAAYLAKAQAVLGPEGEAARLRWLGVAESSHRRALELSPRSSSSLYGLSVLYEFELDRPEDAVPLLATLIEVEPSNVDAYLLLGRVYYRLGRLEEAAEAYGEAARLAKPLDKRSSSSVDRKKAAEENRARILEELDGDAGK